MAAPALDKRHRGFNTMAWLLGALILQVGVSRWQAPDVIGVDYFTLWAVPAALSSVPDRDIYSYDNQRLMANALRTASMPAPASPMQQQAQRWSDQLYDGRIDATGSPLLYALVGLASSGRFDDDLHRFTIVCFVAFLIAIGLLCGLLGFSPAETAVAVAAYSLASAPLQADFRVANVNQLQLLILSVFLWLFHSGHRLLAGVTLGAGIMFKPNIMAVLVVIILVILVDRRARTSARFFAGVAAGAVLAVMTGVAYFGTFGVWGQFLTSIGRTLRAGYPLNSGNFAPASVVATLSGVEVSLWLTLGVFAAVLFVLVRTRARRDGESPAPLDEQFLTVGLGCAGMLLASRLVWIHYYLLLVPLSLYFLRPKARGQGGPIGPAVAMAALLILSPAAMAVSDLSLHVAVMANVATFLLFAAGLHAWWMVRSATIAPEPQGKRRRSG